MARQTSMNPVSRLKRLERLAQLQNQNEILQLCLTLLKQNRSNKNKTNDILQFCLELLRKDQMNLNNRE